MSGSSRGVLLGAAALLIGAAAGVSTLQGEGWITPMAILLAGVLTILIFSVLLMRQESERGSTPINSVRGSSSEGSQIENQDNLPDPMESGIDLPIL